MELVILLITVEIDLSLNKENWKFIGGKFGTEFY